MGAESLQCLLFKHVHSQFVNGTLSKCLNKTFSKLSTWFFNKAQFMVATP